jgi:hypothetical protein
VLPWSLNAEQDIRMKTEHVKTPETTEEVSSDGMEKRVERCKSQRTAPFAREKPMVDLEKSLQLRGAGRKSRKRPARVVGKKPNGKCQTKSKRNVNNHFSLAPPQRAASGRGVKKINPYQSS